ncbi:MAG: hypothetical protein M3Y40_08015, partial [Chloroflexota bacterium]|nr:hypothetical protein [Chloroflexota bacterium]
DALDDLAATRDDRVAAAAYPDYAIRHAPAVSDWALRHPAATYTLTWPGQGETELRSQVKPD